jgi:hypothetical protein
VVDELLPPPPQAEIIKIAPRISILLKRNIKPPIHEREVIKNQQYSFKFIKILTLTLVY